jgi:uncharacterized protein YggT (Ycf19 family)
MERTVKEVERTVVQDSEPVRQREVVDTTPTVNTVARVITLIGGIIMGLLAVRFLLSLLGANRGNAFAEFIYTITHPFVAPFFGLFNYEMVYGQARFEVETLVAIAVYGLLTWLLVRAVSLGDRRTI